MKLLSMASAASILALTLASGAARADAVNFDEFTSPPVTCCYGNPVVGPLVYANVTVAAAGATGTVMNGSGWSGMQTSGENLFGTLDGSMTLTFGNGASGLNFDLINGFFSDEVFTVNLYDAGHILIGSHGFAIGQFTTAAGVVHASFAESGIFSADILGNGDFAIDTIGFDAGAVPEPATWALMISGFGLAGAALRRRKMAVA